MARIDCPYCGGGHPTAAEVRTCWEASRATPLADPPPAPVTTPPPRFGQQIRPYGVGSAGQVGKPGAAGLGEGFGAAAAHAVLGRSVVVAPGRPPPPAWEGVDRVRAEPGSLEALESAWRARRPLVVELGGGLDDDLDDGGEVERRPVWSLEPAFSFPAERLAHAVWANAYDGRAGGPRWRWADAAAALGAAAGGPADVVLPDGRPAFCDGGPLQLPPADGLPVPGAALVPRVALEHGRLAPLGGNAATADLAPDQLAAVTHDGGAARIIAPAGSGKTRVLTERARHLLRRWGVPGGAVCLVAFNRRAAAEMVERTPDLPELQIRTLNSLALAIVSDTGAFGSGRSVQTIDEPEVRRILDGLVKVPRRANTDPVATWLEALSAVRLGLRPPKEVEAFFDGDVDGLPGVFERYRSVLSERGVLDFDEQVYRAIEVLLTDPARRRRARAACRLLLVDEFQDLTPAHLLLIRLLAGPDGAVFGVGDDDQVIYGYAGATPDWLIHYTRYFPGAGDHPLRVNYRCPPAVVGAAVNLLSHNRRRVPKDVAPAPGRSDDPAALSVRGADDPVDETLAVVRARLDEGAQPADVAVLARVNAALAPVQVGLAHAGVPVGRAVGPEYLDRAGVRAALAWLRIALRPGRLAAGDVAFTARRPARALSPRVVEWMAEQGDASRLRRLAGRLEGRDGPKVEAYADDVDHLGARAAAGATAAELLAAVRDEVGLGGAMEALDTSRHLLGRSAQTDDLDALVALARLHPETGSFEAWLRDSLSRPGDPGGVTVATVHAVKGREWPHVVLHAATAGVLPHRLAEDVEEERRIFHVALTRCRHSVTVVTGSPRSPFVAELDELAPEVPEPADVPADRPVRSPRPVPAAGAPAQPPADAARVARVADALRAWRLERSRADGVPAYVVLHDATIQTIAEVAPSGLVTLGRVKGIGPAKLERYGDEILATVEEATGA